MHRRHIGAIDPPVDLGALEAPDPERQGHMVVPVVRVVEGGTFRRRVQHAHLDHRINFLSLPLLFSRHPAMPYCDRIDAIRSRAPWAGRSSCWLGEDSPGHASRPAKWRAP